MTYSNICSIDFFINVFESMRQDKNILKFNKSNEVNKPDWKKHSWVWILTGMLEQNEMPSDKVKDQQTHLNK